MRYKILSGYLMARYFELIFIFTGIPLFYYFSPYDIPKIPVLLLVMGFCLYILYRDKYFFSLRLSFGEITRADILNILKRYMVILPVILLFVFILKPENFLDFPKKNFGLWVLILFLYPLLSALPQEIVYRVFFFHRYKHIIPGDRIKIILSSLLFSFLHIIYHNWVAVVFTLAGGLLFATTYHNKKSLLLVSLEHSLYGITLFTAGLGSYFY